MCGWRMRGSGKGGGGLGGEKDWFGAGKVLGGVHHQLSSRALGLAAEGLSGRPAIAAGTRHPHTWLVRVLLRALASHALSADPSPPPLAILQPLPHSTRWLCPHSPYSPALAPVLQRVPEAEAAVRAAIVAAEEASMHDLAIKLTNNLVRSPPCVTNLLRLAACTTGSMIWVVACLSCSRAHGRVRAGSTTRVWVGRGGTQADRAAPLLSTAAASLPPPLLPPL